MAKENSDSVRNGVIATVVGGIILTVLAMLWSPFKLFLLWLWEQVIWLGSFFTDSYSVKGWVLFSLALLILPAIARIISSVKKSQPAPYKLYIEDALFDAKWCWSWSGSEISNLWCLCPKCESELVYDDHYDLYGNEPRKTIFICENCNRKTIASIVGGNKGYALSAVQREIRRRIRTGEYLKSLEK